MKRPDGMSRQEAALWFIEYKTTINANGCVVANKSLAKSGYATLRYENKTYAAHRFIYSVMVGEPPSEMDICHTCDNRACVNPAHLFIGTRKDNMQDAKRKGRVHKPYANQVLTPEDAVEIRKRYGNGASTKALARKYGISTNSVLRVLRGETFAYAGGSRFRPGKPHGEWHPAAKLDDSAVREIRRVYSKGEKNQVELAAYYKVSQSAISSIVLNKTWRGVE